MRQLFGSFGNSRSATEKQRMLVEETKFDGRSIRKYNDGSIKAATSNGWMSFFDFEEFEAYANWRKIRRQKKT